MQGAIQVLGFTFLPKLCTGS